jgi:hypothetical protein
MMAEMGVDATLLSDPTEVLDTPADGEFRMYAGGTTQAEIKDAPNAISTFLLQPYQLDKTKKLVENTWNHEVPKLNIPMGVDWTDEFLMKVSELTGKPIPGVAGQGARPPGRPDVRFARLAARQEVRPLRRPGLRHGHGQDSSSNAVPSRRTWSVTTAASAG